jgi:hypothetical protein
MFHDKYDRWRDYLRAELGSLIPELSPDALNRRVDLAVAMADGLLVTFALEDKKYRLVDRRAIVEDMITMLGLGGRRAAAA